MMVLEIIHYFQPVIRVIQELIIYLCPLHLFPIFVILIFYKFFIWSFSNNYIFNPCIIALNAIDGDLIHLCYRTALLWLSYATLWDNFYRLTKIQLSIHKYYRKTLNVLLGVNVYVFHPLIKKHRESWKIWLRKTNWFIRERIKKLILWDQSQNN